MDGTLQEVRTLDVIEMEIQVLQNQTQRVVLSYAIETGRRLEEAKAMVGHGQWGDWLKKMGYSQSTAVNLMRVFREYGASQQNLFGGDANSQALANLSFTKALRLLALPDQEEREAFVAENDVENMSTRELEKALKERAEALAAAEAAQADAKAAEESRAKMEVDIAMLREQFRSSQEAVSAAQKELEELKAKPVDVAVMSVDQEKLDQARAEAVAEMQAKVDKATTARDKADEKRKAAEAALAKADEKRKAAEAALAKANAKLEASAGAEKKSVISSDGDLSAFRVLFDQTQNAVNEMHSILLKVHGREDNSKAAGLQKALSALSEMVGKAAEV